MLYYKTYAQKRSDKIGVEIMRQAQKRDNIKYEKEINTPAYSNILSDNYKYHDKHIVHELFDINGLGVESIHYDNQEQKHALIQLHGGAYVHGFNDTYRKVAGKYLELHRNLKVYSLKYSLGPEKPFPHALNDAVTLYNYLLEDGVAGENIIIAGDSAGGGLAIAMTLFLRDHDIELPKALITMSAWTNLRMDGESHLRNMYVDIMFGVGTEPLDIVAYTTDYDVTIPYISPFYGDFTKFTDMLMFVGGDEIIESDTLVVANKAKENNEIYVHNFLGMFHVFPFGFNLMASSKKSWKLIEEYIGRKFKGQ